MDSSLTYVAVALVPNLLVMLWVMARMHREIHATLAKLGMVESDNRVLDEGLKVLAEEVRQIRISVAVAPHAPGFEPPASKTT